MPHGIFLYKAKPGVYKMLNTETGNFYIGSSINVSQRIKTHKQQLRLGYKGNIRIREDLEKHGSKSFKFEVLEYCDSGIIKQREQYYFELLKPYYNVWKSVYNATGRSYTPEQLQSFKMPHPIKDKEAFKEKLRKAWEIRRTRPDGIAMLKMLNRTGKLHTDEAKAKMSLKGKGRPKSPEFKEKLRRAHLGTKWDRLNRTWIKPLKANDEVF